MYYGLPYTNIFKLTEFRKKNKAYTSYKIVRRRYSIYQKVKGFMGKLQSCRKQNALISPRNPSILSAQIMTQTKLLFRQAANNQHKNRPCY